jgi:ribosome-binding factor A
MATDRLRRVNTAVLHVLSDAVTTDLKDPRVGFVTVTGVEISPDLRHARVFVSVLGTPAEQDASIEGLASAHGFLQRRVASELKLKHTPTLEFTLDHTAETAQRIGRLISETEAEAEQR